MGIVISLMILRAIGRHFGRGIPEPEDGVPFDDQPVPEDTDAAEEGRPGAPDQPDSEVSVTPLGTDEPPMHDPQGPATPEGHVLTSDPLQNAGVLMEGSTQTEEPEGTTDSTESDDSSAPCDNTDYDNDNPEETHEASDPQEGSIDEMPVNQDEPTVSAQVDPREIENDPMTTDDHDELEHVSEVPTPTSPVLMPEEEAESPVGTCESNEPEIMVETSEALTDSEVNTNDPKNEDYAQKSEELPCNEPDIPIEISGALNPNKIMTTYDKLGDQDETTEIMSDAPKPAILTTEIQEPYPNSTEPDDANIMDPSSKISENTDEIEAMMASDLEPTEIIPIEPVQQPEDNAETNGPPIMLKGNTVAFIEPNKPMDKIKAPQEIDPKEPLEEFNSVQFEIYLNKKTKHFVGFFKKNEAKNCEEPKKPTDVIINLDKEHLEQVEKYPEEPLTGILIDLHNPVENTEENMEIIRICPPTKQPSDSIQLHTPGIGPFDSSDILKEPDGNNNKKEISDVTDLEKPDEQPPYTQESIDDDETINSDREIDNPIPDDGPIEENNCPQKSAEPEKQIDIDNSQLPQTPNQMFTPKDTEECSSGPNKTPDGSKSLMVNSDEPVIGKLDPQTDPNDDLRPPAKPINGQEEGPGISDVRETVVLDDGGFGPHIPPKGPDEATNAQVAQTGPNDVPDFLKNEYPPRGFDFPSAEPVGTVDTEPDKGCTPLVTKSPTGPDDMADIKSNNDHKGMNISTTHDPHDPWKISDPYTNKKLGGRIEAEIERKVPVGRPPQIKAQKPVSKEIGENLEKEDRRNVDETGTEEIGSTHGSSYDDVEPNKKVKIGCFSGLFKMTKKNGSKVKKGYQFLEENDGRTENSEMENSEKLEKYEEKDDELNGGEKKKKKKGLKKRVVQIVTFSKVRKMIKEKRSKSEE